MYSDWDYDYACTEEYLVDETDPLPRPQKYPGRGNRDASNLTTRLGQIAWYTSGFL